jgi:hypothetical protein
MFLFTPIQIEQLKSTHDYLKTDGKPIHLIEADGKPIHCIAADRVAYFWQLVDAVHETLKYYNFPNNPKMSGFYVALLEENNHNVDIALHCMCVFIVVDQLINDNFLHVWEIINLHHKLYVAIESFDDFYREVKHQQNLLPAPVLDPSYLKSLLPCDEYSDDKGLDKFITHVSQFVSPKHFLGNVPVPSSPSHSASQPVEGTWISPINVDASLAPSHSASQPPVAHNPPAQNPTASDLQHIPGSQSLSEKAKKASTTMWLRHPAIWHPSLWLPITLRHKTLQLQTRSISQAPSVSEKAKKASATMWLRHPAIQHPSLRLSVTLPHKITLPHKTLLVLTPCLSQAPSVSEKAKKASATMWLQHPAIQHPSLRLSVTLPHKITLPHKTLLVLTPCLSQAPSISEETKKASATMWLWHPAIRHPSLRLSITLPHKSLLFWTPCTPLAPAQSKKACTTNVPSPQAPAYSLGTIWMSKIAKKHPTNGLWRNGLWRIMIFGALPMVWMALPTRAGKGPVLYALGVESMATLSAIVQWRFLTHRIQMRRMLV